MTERTYYSREAALRARRNKTVLASLSFILGAGVGAITAILFSPASGEDVREEIADEISDAYKSGKDQVKEGVSRVQDMAS